MERVQKMLEGQPLYWLPQPDVEVPYTQSRRIQTTEVTDEPVMTSERVPMMDGDVQRTYPVTQPVYDDSGAVVGQEETGQLIPLWTLQPVQQTNDDGDPLFWQTVEEELTRVETVPPLEITAEDERYVEGLEEVWEWVEVEAQPPEQQTPTLEERINAIESAVTTLGGL